MDTELLRSPHPLASPRPNAVQPTPGQNAPSENNTQRSYIKFRCFSNKQFKRLNTLTLMSLTHDETLLLLVKVSE